MTPDQILFIMGHYILHHNLGIFLYFSILSLVIFYLTFKTANFLLNRYKKTFGFTSLHDIASFPLLLFLFNIFFLLSTPIFNSYSRYMEKEADRFGLEITKNNKAAAEAFYSISRKKFIQYLSWDYL